MKLYKCQPFYCSVTPFFCSLEFVTPWGNMGWGEFDCRQPSCSCLGFSSWHVLRRPTVMGMWECWGGDQIHPKKWWQRLHVPLLLTNFMSFFCAKFKLLMSSNGLKNINMCMDESWVMRNFDVSLGSHCESRLDLINKRCTSGGNIDCFWMNFVRPFWDISQMLPTSAQKDGIPMEFLSLKHFLGRIVLSCEKLPMHVEMEASFFWVHCSPKHASESLELCQFRVAS